jgi:hypothetical protein
MTRPLRPLDEYEAEEFLNSPKTRRLMKRLDTPATAIEGFQEFEKHPLYRRALRFGTYVHRVARLYRPRRRKRDPKAVDELVLQAYLMGAMIAAGVGRLDDTEIGFSIAYLKRGLRATHLALQALHDVRGRRHFPEKAADHVTRRLVGVRDDIVSEVMSLRQAWRRMFAR